MKDTTITFRLTKEEKQQLQALAANRGISKLIREAIQALLKGGETNDN